MLNFALIAIEACIDAAGSLDWQKVVWSFAEPDIHTYSKKINDYAHSDLSLHKEGISDIM